MDFENKVALVTGGTSGIGKVICTKHAIPLLKNSENARKMAEIQLGLRIIYF